MNNRKRIMDCVQKAHNAVTDASLEVDSFSYADQIAVMTDSLISSGVTIPVRCKNCTVPHNRWTGCPNLNGLVTPPDFYCAYGERVDNEN